MKKVLLSKTSFTYVHNECLISIDNNNDTCEHLV